MNSTTVQPAAVHIAPPRHSLRGIGPLPGFDRFLRKALRLLAGLGRRRFPVQARKLCHIGTNIVGYIDRRTQQQLEAGRVIEQERADQLFEQRWKAMVKANWKERARVLNVPRAWLSPANPKPAMLSRQAD